MPPSPRTAKGAARSGCIRPGVLEVVSVPITLGLDRPELLGVLSIGYLLDDRRAAQFKALTGADIAFAMDGVVRASTLGPGLGSRADAAPRGRRRANASRSAAKSTSPCRSRSARTAASANRRRSSCARAASACARSAPFKPRSPASRIGATLLAIVVSYGVARTITRPLASITDHMRHIAATGDLTRQDRHQAPGRLGR